MESDIELDLMETQKYIMDGNKNMSLKALRHIRDVYGFCIEDYVKVVKSDEFTTIGDNGVPNNVKLAYDIIKPSTECIYDAFLLSLIKIVVDIEKKYPILAKQRIAELPNDILRIGKDVIRNVDDK